MAFVLWDKDNRLRGVTQPSGALHAYEYDANGLRTKKTEAGVETRFLLDGVSVLAELDATNAATVRYLLNPEAIDDIYAFETGGAQYFPLTDALGSIVAVTDSTGAVVRRNEYEVYGARTTSGTGPALAFGFTGREQDATGGRYHRDRYASAVIGRWLSADRASMIDGPSLYQYLKSNPVQNSDPEGTYAIEPTGNSVFVDAVNRAITFTGIGYQLNLFIRIGGIPVRVVEVDHEIDPTIPGTMGNTKPEFPGVGCSGTGHLSILTRINQLAFYRFESTNRAARYRLEELIVHELGHAASMIEQIEAGVRHVPTLTTMSRYMACRAGREYRRERGLNPALHDAMGGTGPLSDNCASVP